MQESARRNVVHCAVQAPLNARLARRQRELEEEETERKRKEAAAAKLRALDEAIAARDAERSVASGTR